MALELGRSMDRMRCLWTPRSYALAVQIEVAENEEGLMCAPNLSVLEELR